MDNVLKIRLREDGSVEEMPIDFKVTRGGYRNILIAIEVPKTLLIDKITENDKNIAGNNVRIAANITTSTGRKLKTKQYEFKWIKEFVFEDQKYALYQRQMPKEFTLWDTCEMRESASVGVLEFVINVVNWTLNEMGAKIEEVSASPKVKIAVYAGNYLDDDEEIESPSDFAILQSQVQSQKEEIDELKHDLYGEGDETLGEFLASRFKSGWKIKLEKENGQIKISVITINADEIPIAHIKDMTAVNVQDAIAELSRRTDSQNVDTLRGEDDYLVNNTDPRNPIVMHDTSKIDKTSIADNLITEDKDKVLSAKQGNTIRKEIERLNKNILTGNEALNNEKIARENSDTALKESITNLDNLKASKTEMTDAISKAIGEIVGSAPQAFDTLKEIADWIENDEEGTAALILRVNDATALAQQAKEIAESAAEKGGTKVNLNGKFQIEWEANNAWLLQGGTRIPFGADLNDYKEIGNYWCPSNDASIINSPTTLAFILKVYDATGDGHEIEQELIEYNTQTHYARNLKGGEWHRITLAQNEIQNTTWMLQGGMRIPNDADLNEYRTVGNYWCPINKHSIKNTPTDKAFILKVYDATGDGSEIEQEFIQYNDQQHYTRNLRGGEWHRITLNQNELQNTTWLLTGGIEIPENSDLNDYTTVGNYYVLTNDIGATIKNSPTSVRFSLKVFDIAGFIKQELISYDTLQHYCREVLPYKSEWYKITVSPDEFVKKSGDAMTGNLRAPHVITNAIEAPFTSQIFPIEFLNNSSEPVSYGFGVRIGADGTTIVAAGESGKNAVPNISSTNDEKLYLLADSDVIIKAYAQNWGTGTELKVTNSGVYVNGQLIFSPSNLPNAMQVYGGNEANIYYNNNASDVRLNYRGSNVPITEIHINDGMGNGELAKLIAKDFVIEGGSSLSAHGCVTIYEDATTQGTGGEDYSVQKSEMKSAKPLGLLFTGKTSGCNHVNFFPWQYLMAHNNQYFHISSNRDAYLIQRIIVGETDSEYTVNTLLSAQSDWQTYSQGCYLIY